MCQIVGLLCFTNSNLQKCGIFVCGGFESENVETCKIIASNCTAFIDMGVDRLLSYSLSINYCFVPIPAVHVRFPLLIQPIGPVSRQG